MHDSNTSYSFIVNNTRAYGRLLVFCTIEFLMLLVLFFWWMVTSLAALNLVLWAGLSVLVGLPMFTFYFFRKKTTEEITVQLSVSEMMITWPSKQLTISFTDIKHYSASHILQDTYERESVRIRLKNGKEIRLTATSDLCDIKALQNFREAFDRLALNIAIENKPNVEERLLMTK